MKKCSTCHFEKCLCNEIEEFMNVNQELMDNLAELEAQHDLKLNRCEACFFFRCRCNAKSKLKVGK